MKEMETNPNVDIPLLRKHVEWVEEEAAKPWADRVWAQDYWIIPSEEAYPSSAEINRGECIGTEERNFCGTCYCLAGNIAAQDGYRVYAGGMARNPETNETVDPETYAREKLGINYDEAERLFDGENSAEDIRRIAEEIVGERL